MSVISWPQHDSDDTCHEKREQQKNGFITKSQRAMPNEIGNTLERGNLESRRNICDCSKRCTGQRTGFGLFQTPLVACPLFRSCQNEVNRRFKIILPSDNSNTSHTHLTWFYCRPRTIAPYFSLLLKTRKKTRTKNFQISLPARHCYNSSQQLILTNCA